MSLRLKCPGCGKQLVVNNQSTSKRVQCPACARSIVIPVTTDDTAGDAPPIDHEPAEAAPKAPDRLRRHRPFWIFVAGTIMFVVCLIAALPAGVNHSPLQFGVVAGPLIGVFGALGFFGTTSRLREMSRPRLCYMGGLVVVLLGFAGLTGTAYVQNYRSHPLNALFGLVVCLGAVLSLVSAAIGGVLAIRSSPETGGPQVSVAHALGGMATAVVIGVSCIFLMQAVPIMLFVVGLIFAPILFVASAVFLIRALGRS